MKNYITFLLFFLGITIVGFSQDENPIEVETSVKQISDTEYDLIFDLYIDEDWHLYSQYNPEDASLPMNIKPSEGESGYTLVGKAKESETHKEFSEIWGVEEIFFAEEAQLIQRIRIEDANSRSRVLRQVSLNIEAQVCKEFCLPYDGDFTFAIDGGEVEEVIATVGKKDEELTNALKLNLKNPEILESASSDANKKEEGGSLLQIFLLGFAGGLLAFLTPCVFPLIPLTVSFFTKQSEKRSTGVRNSILYGIFIVIIYVLISLPFHFIDSLDPEILNTISTNIWLNIFFFVVLIFFAGSFFGFYSITLPSSWGNKMDNASGIGGVIGIFFMALTLAIVSFSCTGPILGSLLAGSLTSSGGPSQLTAGMGGFGVALALPFAFFALFPSLLKALPKSGYWLDFIRIFIGVLVLGIAVYLTPGVMKDPKWNQNALSGFAPPQFYSIYEQDNNCPLALDCYKDFDQGMAYAKSVGKPVLVDFTGWACVNCRKMEENVWSDPNIYNTLKKDYVLISLYVDDNENKLPVEEQFDFVKPSGKIKKITTYGEKWATMQTVNFKNASQPFYILMDTDLKVLNKPEQYTDVTSYYKWLKDGLKEFKN